MLTRIPSGFKEPEHIALAPLRKPRLQLQAEPTRSPPRAPDRLSRSTTPPPRRGGPPGAARRGKVEFDVKRVLLVTLVLVVLVTGIPIVMGMPMVACTDCDLATIMTNTCMLAVLEGLVALALSLLALRLAARAPSLAGLIVSSGLDRPPRLA